MSSITISKTEYVDLKARANAYESMLKVAQITFSLTPPEKSRKNVVRAFKETGEYTKEFIASLSKGLNRSSYFKA